MSQTASLRHFSQNICQIFIQLLQKPDPEVYVALQPFKGHTLKLEATDLNIILYFKVLENNIHVSNTLTDHQKVTTTLSGQLTDIVLLTFKKEYDISTIKQHNIAITGNTSFLMTFNQVFQDIDIDIEEHLSYFLGDFAAYNINQSFNAGINWMKTTHQHRIKDMTIYLQEEIKLLPTKTEIEILYQDIHNTKIRLEVLEKRLQRLEQS